MNERITSVLAVIDTKPKRRPVNRNGGRSKSPRAYVKKCSYETFYKVMKRLGI